MCVCAGVCVGRDEVWCRGKVCVEERQGEHSKFLLQKNSYIHPNIRVIQYQRLELAQTLLGP